LRRGICIVLCGLRTMVDMGFSLVFQINLLCDPESRLTSLNLPKHRGLECWPSWSFSETRVMGLSYGVQDEEATPTLCLSLTPGEGPGRVELY
jgi:hypothetical protein